MAMFAIRKIQVWHFTIRVETVRSDKKKKKTELVWVTKYHVCPANIQADTFYVLEAKLI